MEEEIRQVDQELQCTQVALKEVEGLHLKGQVYERRSAIFFKARRDTTIQHQRGTFTKKKEEKNFFIKILCRKSSIIGKTSITIRNGNEITSKCDIILILNVDQKS